MDSPMDKIQEARQRHSRVARRCSRIGVNQPRPTAARPARLLPSPTERRSVPRSCPPLSHLRLHHRNSGRLATDVGP